ncbi:MAG: NUDIX domain-containing protein [Clostridia bacterium]|nr:NUDIX domain-containing protein [Clostridia bacterium]
MNYQQKKAKYAYHLFKKGLPFKKAYAVVEKGDKFVVLNNLAKDRYSLSGGGVDRGEDNIAAVKREVMEEMNMEIEIARSLGVVSYPSDRKYKNHEFVLECQAEIFYARFVGYGDNKDFGIKGEFSDNIRIVELTKEEMIKKVDTFTKLGVKLD